MSIKILFLAEAGEGIGSGHLSRSIALADGFDTFDCDISFVIRGVKNPVIHRS
jgi:spore coat polysaccharide biosynthesis predicted glycosyltransferase SpsG